MITHNQTNRVVLKKSELKKDLMERGLSREEMAEKYGLPKTQMNKAIDQAGLKGVRTRKVDFIFDNEEEIEERTEENQPSSMATTVDTVREIEVFTDQQNQMYGN